MTSGAVFNLVTVILSVSALIVSAWAARRQITLSRGATMLPVILQAFRDSREPAFRESQQYIYYTLGQAHSPDRGYTDLPPNAVAHVRRISYFYDDLGKLIAHGAVEEELIIGGYGAGIQRAWNALAPFIEGEREKNQANVFVYFEHLAARARFNPSAEIYKKMGLSARYREYSNDLPVRTTSDPSQSA